MKLFSDIFTGSVCVISVCGFMLCATNWINSHVSTANFVYFDFFVFYCAFEHITVGLLPGISFGF